ELVAEVGDRALEVGGVGARALALDEDRFAVAADREALLDAVDLRRRRPEPVAALGDAREELAEARALDVGVESVEAQVERAVLAFELVEALLDGRLRRVLCRGGHGEREEGQSGGNAA